MGKKDPRIIKTLRQIDDALLENLAVFPFSKITIDMICRSAMINRSTFYKYYEDKYNLLNNILQRILDEFRKSADTSFILATPVTIDNDIYISIFNQFIYYIQSKQEIFQILWNADVEQEIFDMMQDIITEQILETLNIPELNHESQKYAVLYARLFSSNLMTIIEWWFGHIDTVSSDDIRNIMTKNMKDACLKLFKNSVPKIKWGLYILTRRAQLRSNIYLSCECA